MSNPDGLTTSGFFYLKFIKLPTLIYVLTKD